MGQSFAAWKLWRSPACQCVDSRCCRRRFAWDWAHAFCWVNSLQQKFIFMNSVQRWQVDICFGCGPKRRLRVFRCYFMLQFCLRTHKVWVSIAKTKSSTPSRHWILDDPKSESTEYLDRDSRQKIFVSRYATWVLPRVYDKLGFISFYMVSPRLIAVRVQFVNIRLKYTFTCWITAQKVRNAGMFVLTSDSSMYYPFPYHGAPHVHSYSWSLKMWTKHYRCHILN